jgi:ankyrin repeat protein
MSGSIVTHVRRGVGLALVSLLGVLAAGCQSSGPTEPARPPAVKAARAELAKAGVAYNEESFRASAAAGKTAVVKLFLDAGMNPDVPDTNGGTALMDASEKGQTEIVKILLAAKADPSATAPRQEPPLFRSIQNGHVETARVLLQGGAKVEAQAGPPVDDTPLGRALSRENDSMARILLDAGANVNGKGDGQRSPIMIAAEKGKLDLVTLLLSRGADVTYRVPGGASVLFAPVREGYVEVVKALLAAGADAKKDREALLSLAGQSKSAEMKRVVQQAVGRKPAAPRPAASAEKPAPKARGTSGGTASGKAEGTFTVGDETTPLSYAYAVAEKGSFDPKKEDIVLILSDVPLDAEAIEKWSVRSRMAEEGRLHAVELRIDAKKQVIGGDLRHPGSGMTSVSVTGMHVFEPKLFDGRTVSGKASVKKPTDLFGKTTFEYSASFEANVYRKPKRVPASAEQKAAAGKSLQAKAYRAYEAALAAGDLAALKETVVAELARQMEEPEAATMLEMMKLARPTDVTFERVSVTGGKATLHAVGKQDTGAARGTIELLREGGAWKVGKQSWSNE